MQSRTARANLRRVAVWEFWMLLVMGSLGRWVAWGMLHGLDYSDFRVNALKPMRAAADHILGLEDGKKRFADCVLRMILPPRNVSHS
ncbi:hypothetical protein [Edaphobacter aggregans]|uniref:hypothetical protein n=1 Tax=Edaphobacter aggregans TaxID=570835 RepID=UPI000557D610|nr:hypothetical protein [Edaphobacter aggregans]